MWEVVCVCACDAAVVHRRNAGMNVGTCWHVNQVQSTSLVKACAGYVSPKETLWMALRVMAVGTLPGKTLSMHLTKYHCSSNTA